MQAARHQSDRLLVKLRALKHQAGATRAPVPTAPAGAGGRQRAGPRDAHDLRRLLRLRAAVAPPPASAVHERALPGTEIAPGLRLLTACVPAGAVPARIGGAFDWRADFTAARVVFFDTETTGLAGGTGTRAFMIGAAAWDGGTLQVRQLLMTRLGAEAAMLAAFARWLAPSTALVSYNGKSFDAPLLQTRYRLARLPDPIAGLEHVDLLHPARRRYRDRLENCRLATIERQVLGVHREDDLPGSEAPAAWRGYLRGGSADKLCRVLAHNQQDVVSLAKLLLHLSARQELAP